MALKQSAITCTLKESDITESGIVDVQPIPAGADKPAGGATKKRSSKPKIAGYKRTIGAEIRNMAGPIRRLIISKVVLRNFKSYGGTTVIGPFHKRFTSIVGPNGSGKSNVIDSMLFVFGFRAKQMRFEKLSELIHNSNGYVKLNRGRPIESLDVSVHFCEILDHNPDIDDFEVIEGSELVITRQVFRDNSSRYLINGNTATHKVVSNSLKSFGMDLYNNRFLILQGEVEQISQMKPKATKPDEEGLLEYLEDIIGTNQYLDQIKEAQIAYEQLQDEYQERCNRTRAAQKEVEDLMEPKKEAYEYCKKEQELYKNMIMLIQKETADISKNRKIVTTTLGELESKFNEANDEMEAVEMEKKTAIAKIKTAEIALERATKNQKRLNDAFQKLCSNDEDLRKQLLREVKKVEEKTKSIQNLNTKKPIHEKNSQEMLKKANELMMGIPAVQAELDAAESALEELTDKLKPEMDIAQKQLATLESALAPIQQSFDAINKEISIIQASIDLLESRKKESENTIKKYRENESKLIKSIKTNKDSLKKQDADLKSQICTYQKNATEISAMENTIQTKSHLCMQRKGKYESMKREMDEAAGEKSQYKYIMGLVSSGKLKGVHGRLGDLGCIAPQYETAFMAAGGGQVDVLIVDTPEIASQIFDELRKHNLGRCSAMALSVLNNDLKRHMEASEKVALDGLPAGVQKLIDLIQPNQPKYKICFYFALRDTLLAQSLDDATIVGYQHRKRVVTIDGELIEPDGRMSGGGLTKHSGGGLKKFSDKSTDKKAIDPKELEAFQKELDKDMAEVENIKKELRKLNQTQFGLDKSISELKYSTDLLRQTVENEEIQLKEILENIKKVSVTLVSKEEETQLETLKSDLDKKTKYQNHVQEQVKEQEKKVAAAYKALDNVGKGKLKAAKMKVTGLDEKITKMRSDVDKCRKDAANFLADSEKCVRDVQKFEKEIEQHKKRESDLERQLDRLEDEAAGVNEDLEEANKHLEDMKKQVKDLNDFVNEKNKLIEEHSLASVDMKHSIDEMKRELETMGNVLNEHQSRLKESMTQYKKIATTIRASIDADELLKPEKPQVIATMVILDDDEIILEDDDEPTQNPKNIKDDLEFELLDEEAIDGLSAKQLRNLIEELKQEIANVPNLGVIDDFRLKVHEYNKKKQELYTVQKRRDDAKREHEALCLKRKTEFLSNFAIIATKLKEMYQTITLGGDAELELLDSTDPFTEGILFSVRPAKKSWKQIQNLSGGEKTLSSLALVFALHHYKPNPVYFMDEIDAALDFRNVSIIAQNIKERTKDAQFIIISLRNQMFELCNQMVGIYKTMDVTKSVCINPAAFDISKRSLPDDTETTPQEQQQPAATAAA